MDLISSSSSSEIPRNGLSGIFTTTFFFDTHCPLIWKLLAYLTQVQIPETIEQKKSFLLEHHIAVWDVIAECDIIGSSDSSISNVTPTDLSRVLSTAPIRQIYANGATAAKLYHKYQEKITGRDIITLPSTSPANAAFSMERLAENWNCIFVHLTQTI